VLARLEWRRPGLELPRGDTALALACALLALGDVTLGPDWRGPVWVNAIVVPAAALSLAWRRRAPLIVLALVMGSIAGLAVAFGGSQTWSSLFLSVVAVYSAATYASSLTTTMALTASGIAVHDLNDPAISTFGDWVWSSTLAALTVMVGFTGRKLRLREELVRARAEALSQEEERTAERAAEERRRIARELHDIVAHNLGLMVLQAGAAEQILDRDPARARATLESIRYTGQRAIGEMGTLLGLLRGDPISATEPQPSLADLDDLVASMRKAGLDVETVIEGRVRQLPSALDVSTFRIVQEGLTNALKHAGPAHVRVVLCYREQELEVAVEDDGSGVRNGCGSRHGLAGIGERVSVFGGRLDAGPRPEGGWGLRAVLPLTS